MQELKGMPVVNMLNENFLTQTGILKTKGITPRLAAVRIGERDDDISYEKGIIKRFSAVNAEVKITVLPADVSQNELEETITSLNHDKTVHGILLFRPLPKHLSLEPITFIISKDKDVDCMGIVNTANVFAGNKKGYAPCTPQGVIEMLDYYGIDVSGKKAVIVGRSLVAGKPLAMLLLDKNATVTICHTKTLNLANECKTADILISCAGVAKMITSDFTNPDQTVIDVGINMLDGKLCGDVDFDDVKDKVKAVTPVPGGVGTVTTSVLLKHTINSALKNIDL
ncbi:MAG: bifunctional 5,10-methylenetetrahydrofolate dehydrogenase/5,10-methenyltetrahydrofolate cyclohydrolase [Oscillospiraceae bacterium]|nr:bifunctional 5,10-methylenetetrahydrofolate dehydrogenase/5,10-methenyltetrahydrofolate cyclohydrolase [Oscillospiraceae bacterium]